MFLGFKCVDCSDVSQYPQGVCESCGGIRTAAYDLQALKQKGVNKSTFADRPPRLLARWKELMPFRDAEVVHQSWLGETESPMVRSERIEEFGDFGAFHLKLDHLLPSGSLKDRPHSATVAAAVEHGFEVIALSSSGNGASAVAAHAARAGIKAVVAVFSDVPMEKLRKIMAYNPEIITIDGGMDDAEIRVRELAKENNWFNAEAFTNPFNMEGEKTIGLELALQFDGVMPDVVVLPLGNGAATIAPYKGMKELHELGVIDRMPRIIGVQFDACSPIADAFDKGLDDIEPFSRKPSFSTTLMHESPISGRLALECIRESGGAAIAVSDDEVKASMRLLASHCGIYVEPAGGISTAGALAGRRSGLISKDDRVACLVSGSGMNYPSAFPYIERDSSSVQ